MGGVTYSTGTGTSEKPSHATAMDTSASAYLDAHGVQQALRDAVAHVVRTRPANPISAISDFMKAQAKPTSVDPRGLVDTNKDQAVDPATAATAHSLVTNPSSLDLTSLTELSLKKAGISHVPPAIGLCTCVKRLEISLNPQLNDLPEEMRGMQSLRILFGLGCSFKHVPPVVGALPSLYMLSFKSNQLTTIAEGALAPSLQWLILTDNQLTVLPRTLPTGLRKVMLTNNRLTSLPPTILHCTNLELIRLADNQLSALPDGMLAMPNLSWMGLAGNPLVTSSAADALPPPKWIRDDEIDVHEQIGAGGGGFVHRASWRPAPGRPTGPDVALKIFRGAGTVTDGDPRHEIDLGSVLQHPNVIRVLGASPAPRLGLVLELLDTRETWAELGGPPNFDTCTRDTYAPGTTFPASKVLRTLRGVAAACAHLHAKRFTHGDLYAHNTLVERLSGEAKVGDFGAAYHYAPLGAAAAPAIERLEVRAFACMAEELMELLAPPVSEAEPLVEALAPLISKCTRSEVLRRPSFDEIVAELGEVLPSKM